MCMFKAFESGDKFPNWPQGMATFSEELPLPPAQLFKTF